MDNIPWDDMTKPLSTYTETKTWKEDDKTFTGTVNYKKGLVSGTYIVKNVGKYTGDFVNNLF